MIPKRRPGEVLAEISEETPDGILRWNLTEPYANNVLLPRPEKMLQIVGCTGK